jgi:hypothetical protein
MFKMKGSSEPGSQNDALRMHAHVGCNSRACFYCGWHSVAAAAHESPPATARVDPGGLHCSRANTVWGESAETPSMQIGPG